MPPALRIGVLVVAATMVLAASGTFAASADENARVNYMLNCQGCHLPDGSGVPGRVPNLKGFVGNFLRVPGGREFLIRVPGVAGSSLGDTDLAGVMNWMLLNFSREQLPENFIPYTAEEIGLLRKQMLADAAAIRHDLMEEIESAGFWDKSMTP